jgi:hypothetical protein
MKNVHFAMLQESNKFVPCNLLLFQLQFFLTPSLMCRYHCQYGPNDNASHIPEVTKDMYQKKRKLDAKGKYVPNGKGHTGPRTSARMRGSGQRRGCQCNFVVKRLYLEPSIAEITYHEMKHVNLKGFFCHGSTKTGHKSRFSSHLSQEVREFIMTHLHLGLSIPQIMAKHRKRFLEVCESGEELTRDMFICDQDIRNVAGCLAIETYKRDNNDAKSVRMWVQEHPHLVFYYKESGIHVRGAITRDNIPFTIGIQTAWQQDMMLKHGHKKAVSIDATFATNENKVCCLFGCNNGCVTEHCGPWGLPGWMLQKSPL